jgi:death-on-curing protein
LRYLTVEEVIAYHDSEVEPGVRDTHGLASAVEQPQVSAFGEDAYPDVHTKAAALFRGLAHNHPFVDGNKRTAVLATYMFYGFNGYLLSADKVELIHLVVDVATGETNDVEGIAAKLEAWAVPIDELFQDLDR